MVAHSTLAPADFVFPDEVFLRIFKLLCPAIHLERWALRDCLLACRRFYRIAWTHTFSYVVLKGDQASSEPFSHCLQYLLDTSNNHLLPVIQHLEFCGISRPMEETIVELYSELDTCTVERIVVRLPQLKTLKLYGVTWTPCNHYDHPIPDFPILPPVTHTVDLRYVRCKGLPREQLHELLASSSLRRLTLWNVRWTKHIPRIPGSYSIPFSMAYPSTHLTVNGATETVLYSLHSFSDLTHISLWGADIRCRSRIEAVITRNKTTLRGIDIGFDVDCMAVCA